MVFNLRKNAPTEHIYFETGLCFDYDGENVFVVDCEKNNERD